MERKIKTYRFTEDIVKELQELTGRLNISETEAVARAIHYYYLSIVKDEETIKSNAIVSFDDYQKLQNQFSQALYRLGELEGSLKEKDRTIEAKERLIEEKERMIKVIEEDRDRLISEKNRRIEQLIIENNFLRKKSKPFWKFWE